MDETCRQIDAAESRWESGDTLDSREISAAVAHIRQCERCRSLYGSLVPLLRRDAGEPVRRDPGQLVPPVGFTAEVMGKLDTERPPWLRAASRRLVRVGLPIAAVIVVLAGLGAQALGLLFPARSSEVLVRFTLQAPGASHVSLAGDFNGWQPGVLNLKPDQQTGTWEITIPLHKGSVYTYDFLIDGERWVPDPGSHTQVDDGFGGRSSVLRL